MWEAMTAEIRRLGGEVRLESPVEGLRVEDGRVTGVRVGDEWIEPGEVISSLPLRDTVALTTPALPDATVEAAGGLRYRDFLTVALVVEGEDLFPDNWIYIHDPSVQVGRIQNFRSWSPWMVPDETKACVGMEYFCFEGDDLWTMDDDRLVELATRELEQLKLVAPGRVVRGYAVRVPKAYPMYDADYADRVSVIRDWLDTVENLHQVGRNGLHRYNNSDHSSLTAIRAVENITEGHNHDIWAVNAESVYHETDVADEHPYRNAPPTPAMDQALVPASDPQPSAR
jgi:protoporphyrinogen oxidase